MEVGEELTVSSSQCVGVEEELTVSREELTVSSSQSRDSYLSCCVQLVVGVWVKLPSEDGNSGFFFEWEGNRTKIRFFSVSCVNLAVRRDIQMT